MVFGLCFSVLVIVYVAGCFFCLPPARGFDYALQNTRFVLVTRHLWS